MKRTASYLINPDPSDKLGVQLQELIGVRNCKKVLMGSSELYKYELKGVTWLGTVNIRKVLSELKPLALTETYVALQRMGLATENTSALIRANRAVLGMLAKLSADYDDPLVDVANTLTDALFEAIKALIPDNTSDEGFTVHQLIINRTNGDNGVYSILLPPYVKGTSIEFIKRDTEYLYRVFGKGIDPVLKGLEDLCCSGPLMTFSKNGDGSAPQVSLNTEATYVDIEDLLRLRKFLVQKCMEIDYDWELLEYPVIETSVEYDSGYFVTLPLPPRVCEVLDSEGVEECVEHINT